MNKVPENHFVAQLQKRFAYNAAVGSLTFRYAAPPYFEAGESAVRDGMIKHNHQRYPAAKVAWALGYGKWPVGHVGFRDGDPSNFRLENLAPKQEIRAAYLQSLRDERAKTRESKNIPATCCTVCKKPYTEARPRSKTGRRCQPCSTARNRASLLARKYGMSVSAYTAMRTEQDGCCALCSTPDDRLVVDHDHATGSVRRLLCITCNAGLGSFKDTPWLLRLAAEYVEYFKNKA